MANEFEEEYLDVLQNLEAAISGFYAQHRDLSDYSVDRVLDALIRLYKAETANRTAPKITLSELDQALYNAVKSMSDWRLGRNQAISAEAQPEPITADEIIACLKRLRKSVDMWNKSGGRQGYLTFISKFV